MLRSRERILIQELPYKLYIPCIQGVLQHRTLLHLLYVPLLLLSAVQQLLCYILSNGYPLFYLQLHRLLKQGHLLPLYGLLQLYLCFVSVKIRVAL